MHDALLATDDRRLGALPAIWQLQAEFAGDDFREELLHDLLEKREPSYAPFLKSIRAYEAFARSLQDAFDVLKAEAAGMDAQGFDVPGISRDADFVQSVRRLDERYEAAHLALGETTISRLSLQNLWTRDQVWKVRFLSAAQNLGSTGQT